VNFVDGADQGPVLTAHNALLKPATQPGEELLGVGSTFQEPEFPVELAGFVGSDVDSQITSSANHPEFGADDARSRALDEATFALDTLTTLDLGHHLLDWNVLRAGIVASEADLLLHLLHPVPELVVVFLLAVELLEERLHRLVEWE